MDYYYIVIFVIHVIDIKQNFINHNSHLKTFFGNKIMSFVI